MIYVHISFSIIIQGNSSYNIADESVLIVFLFNLVGPACYLRILQVNSCKTTYLDMVLDNLIRSRNTSQSGRWRGLGQGRGRGRGGPGGTIRGRGMGMLNRGPLRVNTRPSPYKIAKASPKLLIFLHVFKNLNH